MITHIDSAFIKFAIGAGGIFIQAEDTCPIASCVNAGAAGLELSGFGFTEEVGTYKQRVKVKIIGVKIP